MRSKIHVRGASTYASGRHCIRNFPILPRKFKIAVTGSPQDRAASKVHDIGLHLIRNAQGEVGFEVLVGWRPGSGADDRSRDSRVSAEAGSACLSRGDPAHLQPRGAPRQHSQGAHQDSREGRRSAEVSGDGRERNGRPRATRRPCTTKRRSSASRRSSCRRATSSLRDEDVLSGRPTEFRNWYQRNTKRHKVAGYRAVVRFR